MMDNDQDLKQLISAYLDGELSEQEKSAVEESIKKDATVKKYFEQLKKLRISLHTWRDEDLSPDLEQRIMNNWQDAKNREGGVMKESDFNWYRVGASAVIVLLVFVVSLQVYMKRELPTRTGAISELELAETEPEEAPQPAESKDQKQVELVKVLEGQGSLSRAIDAVQPVLDNRKSDESKIAYLTKGGGSRVSEVAARADENSRFPLAQSPAIPAGESGRAGGKFKDKSRSFGYTGMGDSLEVPQMEIVNAEQPYRESGDNVVDRDRRRAEQDKEADWSDLADYVFEKQGTELIIPRAQAVQEPLQIASGTEVKPYMQIFRGGRVLNEEDQIEHYSRSNMPYRSKGVIVPPRDEFYWPEREKKEFHTEQYERIYENPFLQVTDNPLSTFSIDVDTASYANTRRFLNNNQLPPPDAVRIEEMINYFVYDYPAPQEGQPFSITTEATVCPWNNAHQLALIGLQGKELAAEDVVPSNLVFLIDVSGSMRPEEKLPLLKRAFQMMVNNLRPQERIAIVTYAGSAGLVLDSTPGSEKQTILNALERLQSGGSTAGGQGIQLAYQVAQNHFIPNGNNRVILATDGDFNVGVSSDGELVRIIEEKRKQGIFLTVLGFGTGNYKDSKMEKIADKGNGNYYYIDTINEARKVMDHELGSTLFTIAKDVKIQIEFNPAQVKAYRLIGYENLILAKEDFNDDTKDAGELGAGHSVTALYEIVPAGSAEMFGDVDPLKYQKKVVYESLEMMTVKLRYKRPKESKSQLITQALSHEDLAPGEHISHNLRFAASVAEFGMLLRDSQYKGGASYLHAIDQAKKAQGTDVWGYRAEFIRLVEKAGLLSQPKPVPMYEIDY